MKGDALAALTAAAQAARHPGFLPEIKVKPGGIDPLGLRQINFDVMDRLIPGTNNVTRNLRPFTLVTWAWHRALELVSQQDLDRVDPDVLLDFVDRMEVIYAWSQFEAEDQETGFAELPGRDALSGMMTAGRYAFGGATWKAFRDRRRNSTSLAAPVNYGPALRALGLLRPHETVRSVMVPAQFTLPALKAFEGRIAGRLHHPAFSRLGPVTVTRKDVMGWGARWDLRSSTAAERRMMRAALYGDDAKSSRRHTIDFLRTKVAVADQVADLRQAMCVPDGEGRFVATAELWRYLQVRQLFRLALEGMFDWMTLQLQDRPRTTGWLVKRFIKQSSHRPRQQTAAQWLQWHSKEPLEAPELIEFLEGAIATRTPSEIGPAISDALSFCLTRSSYSQAEGEREDRLPLARACREFTARRDGTVEELVRQILESWVVAQHVYWAVGRGLADARAGGKRILRLKVVLGERGWELTPGTTLSRGPRATGDRLDALHQLLAQSRALAEP